jgi:HK97 family phage major capsid protein
MEVTIKSITDDEVVLEGYGIVFNTTDLYGEKFAPDTELFLENIKSIPVLWEHNLGDVTDVLGWAKPVKTDEVGVFFELSLRKSNKYIEAIRKFAEMGRLGLSTGALPQTIIRDDKTKTIKRWQVCEISTTVTPAEFRTLGVSQVKALAEMVEGNEDFVNWAKGLPEGTESEELVPVQPPVEDKVEEKVAEEVKTTKIEILEEKMTEEIEKAPEQNDAVKAVEGKVDALTAALEKVVKQLEATPAYKAGYVTHDGGKADKSIKNFGDFLVAIRRGDEQRLASVYGATKDLGEGSGPAGGFLVPEEYSQTLLQVAASQNMIYSRVQRIPVGTESGSYPAIDQYFAPAAGTGQVSAAGGVKATFTAPGAVFTETEPSFTTLQWRLNKVGGLTEVENELVEDSPFAIEALLRSLFALAIAAKNERNILRGTGVGEPLGILNAPCAIGISDTTTSNFKWDDVASMYSRFKSLGGQPVWVIHPSVWPQILKMQNGTDSVFQSNLPAAPQQTLNGYPIIVSEHMPQIGYTGSVLLADLSAYLMFEKAGLSIAYSDQVGFTRDVGVWRFRQRNDGKPWLLDKITLSDPQGSYTVSPFLYLVNS